MYARNPFESLMHSQTADLDRPRSAPRDLMADAFLSQVTERLAEADRHGFVPGYPLPLRGYGNRGFYDPYGEMNGLPVHQGYSGISNTYDPYHFSTRHLGYMGRGVPYQNRDLDRVMDDPFMGTDFGGEYSDDFSGGFMGSDPFMDAEFSDPTVIFEQDSAPYTGPDDMTMALSGGGEPPPVTLGNDNLNPFGSDPRFLERERNAMAAMKRAVRPGMASLSTHGYQPDPGARDPYGADMRNYLRRILRAV